MKTLMIGPWIYCISDECKSLPKDKCGKWMYFFDNKAFVSKICEKAIEEKVVLETKYNDDETGVACFYINGGEVDSHKKVIEFFLTNNLIKKTKAGKFYNISFKYDKQTREGQYGENFKGEIKLDQFIDLKTGKWKLS